ncbi:hypothetical protein [Paenibacillus thermotolerans]|uniref:hypothetical protein n=1 Tax=Paenibacillus thermotolerans TaxID=3027807 RepID=UPI002368D339|nr:MULTISPECIES: hypothetical protein [unclassified Paenibacillus]
MKKAIDVKKVYAYVSEEYGWILTLDKEEAATDPEYTVATLEDLEDAGCLGINFQENILETTDGYFMWFERSFKTLLSDMNEYDCGYVKVEIQ